jgi:hypothetical protein
MEVLDSNGNSLVLGFLEFFVLFEGPSLHQVHFTPQPASPFTGTAVLHYNDGNGEAQCALALDHIDLCPPTGCVPAEVFAYQQGGNPVPMALDWSVTDADNTTVSSGVLQMDDEGFGFTTTGVCLVPGIYTLHVAQPVAAGTSIQVGMTQLGFAYTDGITTPLPIGGSVDLPFDYYVRCADISEGVASARVADAPTLVLEGRVLRITANSGEPLGDLVVLDPMGRPVQGISSRGTSATADLSGLAAGAYLLCPLGAMDRSAQRFILH